MDKKTFYKRLDSVVPGADPQRSLVNNNNLIYFEQLSLSGLDEMHKYSIDERLYEFFEFEPFRSKEETRNYLEKLMLRMSGNIEERTAMYWFVRRKEDGRLVGTAGLVNLNYERKSVEWGYGVDPELWGNGYILQIQQALKEYVFDILELNRLDGITMIHNERTIASLLAAGMKYEGTLRQYYCKKGVFYDGWKYAMLREDYIGLEGKPAHVRQPIASGEVISILADVLGDDALDEESTMYNTSNWDSMNHMAIMVALFEKTKIQLSPIQISNATSVRSITDLLNGKLSAGR